MADFTDSNSTGELLDALVVGGQSLRGLFHLAGSVDYHEGYDLSRVKNVATARNILEAAFSLISVKF